MLKWMGYSNKTIPSCTTPVIQRQESEAGVCTDKDGRKAGSVWFYAAIMIDWYGYTHQWACVHVFLIIEVIAASECISMFLNEVVNHHSLSAVWWLCLIPYYQLWSSNNQIIALKKSFMNVVTFWSQWQVYLKPLMLIYTSQAWPIRMWFTAL